MWKKEKNDPREASRLRGREVAGRYKTKELLTLARIGSLPMLHWKRIKTANILEEVNKDQKRASKRTRKSLASTKGR